MRLLKKISNCSTAPHIYNDEKKYTGVMGGILKDNQSC